MKRFNTKEALSKLFEEFGVFFAFGNAQFAEKKQDGVEYARLISGGYIPSDKLVDYYKAEKALFERAKAYELENNSKETIILYQLRNHEAFYVDEIDDAYDVLKDYGFSYEEVKEVFLKYREQYCD